MDANKGKGVVLLETKRETRREEVGGGVFGEL